MSCPVKQSLWAQLHVGGLFVVLVEQYCRINATCRGSTNSPASASEAFLQLAWGPVPILAHSCILQGIECFLLVDVAHCNSSSIIPAMQATLSYVFLYNSSQLQRSQACLIKQLQLVDLSGVIMSPLWLCLSSAHRTLTSELQLCCAVHCVFLLHCHYCCTLCHELR